MDESAEEYLRLTSKLQRKHFARGYSSISHVAPQPSGTWNPTKSGVSSCPQPLLRLPLKKRKRRDDDDDDDDDKGDTGVKVEKSSALVPALPAEPLAPTSPEATTTSKQPNGTKKLSLMEKWFPGSTLHNATLDSAQAPRLETIDITVARMKAARERLLSLRVGVEDVLRLAPLTTGSEHDLNENTADWDWRELQSALSHFTSSSALRYKKRIERSVRWLFATKPQTAALKSPIQREWVTYLGHHGPEQGIMPSLSLLVWLDSACTTALFSAVVTRLMRGYKRGMCPPAPSAANVTELLQSDEVHEANNCEEDEKGDEYERGDEEKKESAAVEGSAALNNNNTMPPDLYTRLHPLYTESLSDDVSSLLWFLRYFMPVDVEGTTGNASCRTTGYGVWLYACLTAVDTPLDPDLDRLVHSLFRACCRQIQTVGEALGVHGDDRGAILQALSPRHEFDRIEYNTIDDVRRDDILALHTIIIVLSKLFRQNQNRLIPL